MKSTPKLLEDSATDPAVGGRLTTLATRLAGSHVFVRTRRGLGVEGWAWVGVGVGRAGPLVTRWLD